MTMPVRYADEPDYIKPSFPAGSGGFLLLPDKGSFFATLIKGINKALIKGINKGRKA
jgi:hypothetical protein